MPFHMCGMTELTSRPNNRRNTRAGVRLRVKRAGVVLLALGYILGLRTSSLVAQELDPAALLRPATDTWPTYNGDYSGRRFSTLDQINAANVASLTLAWVFH